MSCGFEIKSYRFTPLDIFDYRYKYIHGTAGKKASEELEELLMDVDDILRRLIKLFLTELNHVVQMKNLRIGSKNYNINKAKKAFSMK